MEIDTGVTRTVISEETYDKLRDKLELRSRTAVLSTYTGEEIPAMGVAVNYENQQQEPRPRAKAQTS